MPPNPSSQGVRSIPTPADSTTPQTPQQEDRASLLDRLPLINMSHLPRNELDQLRSYILGLGQGAGLPINEIEQAVVRLHAAPENLNILDLNTIMGIAREVLNNFVIGYFLRRTADDGRLDVCDLELVHGNLPPHIHGPAVRPGPAVRQDAENAGHLYSIKLGSGARAHLRIEFVFTEEVLRSLKCGAVVGIVMAIIECYSRPPSSQTDTRTNTSILKTIFLGLLNPAPHLPIQDRKGGENRSSYERHKANLGGHNSLVTAMAFSLDGKYLATGSENGTLIVYATTGWVPLSRFIDLSPLTSIAWHPSNKRTLFCGFESGDVHTILLPWNEGSGIRTWTDTTDGPISCITHSASDSLLAVGSGEDVYLVRYQMGNSRASWETKLSLPHPLGRQVPGEEGSVLTTRAISAHFLASNTHLVVSYVDRGVVCWDTKDLCMIWEIEARGMQLYVFNGVIEHALICASGRSAISPDEQLIILSKLADGFECYALSDQRSVYKVDITNSEFVPTSVLFDSNGSILFGGPSGAVYVADGAPPVIKQTLECEGEEVVPVLAFFADSGRKRVLVTGTCGRGRETAIQVWEGTIEDDNSHWLEGFMRFLSSAPVDLATRRSDASRILNQYRLCHRLRSSSPHNLPPTRLNLLTTCTSPTEGDNQQLWFEGVLHPLPSSGQSATQHVRQKLESMKANIAQKCTKRRRRWVSSSPPDSRSNHQHRVPPFPAHLVDISSEPTFKPRERSTVPGKVNVLRNPVVNSRLVDHRQPAHPQRLPSAVGDPRYQRHPRYRSNPGSRRLEEEPVAGTILRVDHQAQDRSHARAALCGHESSFFYLLLSHLSSIPDQQKETFRLHWLFHENDHQRKRSRLKRLLPLGFMKSKPAYVGLYCEASLSPGWGHLSVSCIDLVDETVIIDFLDYRDRLDTVTIAVYCLIQLCLVVSEQLKPLQPMPKLFSLKAVVFLTFWQAAGLSFLVTLGLIKDVQTEMFAFLHVKCLTYKVYVPNPSTIEGDLNDHRTPWLKSLSHAMNPMETFRELRAGIKYMVQSLADANQAYCSFLGSGLVPRRSPLFSFELWQKATTIVMLGVEGYGGGSDNDSDVETTTTVTTPAKPLSTGGNLWFNQDRY
ncbi:hypothetical protein BJ322DRAFT_1021205 [Thelephora terrestris]|uniref:Uncharacterized protein n=1 Tax=Thelephora terrestris TaxID=56493 RepID=A0A9P6HED3_9AGAM|nr:hypothetical protein BJ322DRAFT_1021205 [Thelephora terrestris]